jgi:protein PhnA
MKFEKELLGRSGASCEISGAGNDLVAYLVAPKSGDSADHYVLINSELKEQLDGNADLVPNQWRGLTESMWSDVEAVKVVAYRALHLLKEESWAQDLLDQIYLDEDTLEWAKAEMEDEDAVKHFDSNGVQLKSGDSVVLIKDLDVKGSSMVAKRGTAVRNIKLVHDNAELIEGKVNAQTIYIRTEFVKK